MLQRLLRRDPPDVGEQPPARSSVLDQLEALPFFAPVRLYLTTLETMRPWWPVLLPVLAVVALRAYREECERLAARTVKTV